VLFVLTLNCSYYQVVQSCALSLSTQISVFVTLICVQRSHSNVNSTVHATAATSAATADAATRFYCYLYCNSHADGVQDAFYQSDAVLCVSLHMHAPGFFPHPAGSAQQTGAARGAHHTLNVPLAEDCSDAVYCEVFCAALTGAVAAFDPQCIVLQCGADTLSEDPVG
jgi:Histone deacetylase domain